MSLFGAPYFDYTSTLLNPNSVSGVQHSDNWLSQPGGLLGSLIGSIWGPLGSVAGHFAGQNAGASVGDLLGHNWKALGLDVSQNLPPGFQAPGVGGFLNGITGLPLANILGIK